MSTAYAASRRPFDHPLRLALPLLIALFTMGILLPAASAGEEVPDITFRILKLDCEEDPGAVPDGLTPDGCTPAEGVDFDILVEGETEPLTCTTDADGRCSVQVPSESMVTVTEDESTGSEGYTPRENPIETQAVTEFAGAIFVNVLDDAPEPEPTEEPTTGLPDTGAGTTASGTYATGMLVAIATLLASGASLAGAYAVRRTR